MEPLITPTLAIVVVSYQTSNEVHRLVDSLLQHPPTVPWELLVVDNASPDGSGPALADALRDIPNVRVFLSDTNRGFGGANNWAATHTEAPYLALLNPDCWIEADGFSQAIAYLDSHPEVGVVSPKCYRPDGSVEATVRAFPDFRAGIAGRKSVLRRVWKNNPWSQSYMQERRVGDDAVACDWVAGTVMVFRREDWDRLGGFDPDYFMYWEDTDLCWRLRREFGLEVVCLPSGHIVHEGEVSSSRAKAFAIRCFHRSAYLFVRKRLYPSPFHPMRWFCWAALGLRARVLAAKAVQGPDKAEHVRVETESS